jgi:ribonuclease-3
VIKFVYSIVKLFSSRGKKFYSFIYTKTGIAPRDLKLYYQALTHKSAVRKPYRNLSSFNERLEFLGDALLSAIVADVLYREYPVCDEGLLTQMRSRIVSRSRLNEIGFKMGLQEYINAKTQKDLAETHILGDAVEALIGAIYLDLGYKQCHNFVTHKIIQSFIDLEEISQNDSNYKSKLIEWGHKNHHSVDFVTIKKDVEADNAVVFVATAVVENMEIGLGEGSTKKEAQQKAAFSALEYVDSNPDLFVAVCSDKDMNP